MLFKKTPQKIFWVMMAAIKIKLHVLLIHSAYFHFHISDFLISCLFSIGHFVLYLLYQSVNNNLTLNKKHLYLMQSRGIGLMTSSQVYIKHNVLYQTETHKQ